MITNEVMVIVIVLFFLLFMVLADFLVAFMIILYSRSDHDRDTFIRCYTANPGRWFAYKISKVPYPKYNKNKKNH